MGKMIQRFRGPLAPCRISFPVGRIATLPRTKAGAQGYQPHILTASTHFQKYATLRILFMASTMRTNAWRLVFLVALLALAAVPTTHARTTPVCFLDLSTPGYPDLIDDEPIFSSP